MALIPIALPCPRAPAAPRRAVPGSPVQRRGLRGAFAGLALTAAKVARAKAVPEKFPEVDMIAERLRVSQAHDRQFGTV